MQIDNITDYNQQSCYQSIKQIPNPAITSIWYQSRNYIQTLNHIKPSISAQAISTQFSSKYKHTG